MKLSEVLKQDEVKLKDGNYLASVTEEAGYIPTHKETTELHYGKYLFKIKGEGDQLTVVPIATSADGKEFVEEDDNPIIIVSGTTISYTTGRNDLHDKDVYKGRQLHVVEGMKEEDVHRVALLAFLEFVESEYTLGVNDFRLAEAEEIEGEKVSEPAPEPGEGDEGTEQGE